MAAALAPSSEKRRNVGRPATTRALSPYKPKMATSAAVVNSKMLQVKETKIKGLESKIRELEATLVVTQVCSSTCMLVHACQPALTSFLIRFPHSPVPTPQV